MSVFPDLSKLNRLLSLRFYCKSLQAGILAKTIRTRTLRNSVAGKPNLVRVLRRRLGLTQKELAYLVGLGHDVQVSYIENGRRIPRLAEVLMIELVFGVPAVQIFPEIRHAIGDRVGGRAKMLIDDLTRSYAIGDPRVSYKAAQLERVLASLRSPDDEEQGES